MHPCTLHACMLAQMILLIVGALVAQAVLLLGAMAAAAAERSMEEQLREQLWVAARRSYRPQALHIHSCTCFASQVGGFFYA